MSVSTGLTTRLVGTLALVTLALVTLPACGSNAPGYTPYVGFDLGGPGLPTDAGPGSDGGRKDTGAAGDGVAVDGAADAAAGTPDGSASDGGAGSPDSGTPDAGGPDTGAGTPDTGAGTPDAGTPDSGTPDTGTPDAGAPDATWDTGNPNTNTPDAGPSDVPWGSAEDVAPYDAGQFNYGDVQNTGGGTGSGGAGLCIPKISQLNLEDIKKGGKVDIIWWIDTSGSMGQEAKYLNSNLNSFANFIANSAIDYRVILIGKSIGSIKVCVGPPLGGANCSGGPKFLPVQEYISSKNGLDRIIQTYPKWKHFLRKDAVKNFVAVTDDNAYKSATWFISQLQSIGADQFKKTKDVPHGFINHSIVGYPSKSQCSTLASVGTVYLDLTAKTKGEKFKICEQNWAPIFQKLAKSVIESVKPACTQKIPLPTGVSNGKGVTVNYVAEDDYFNVPPTANNSCPASGVGYTLDNPNNPKNITLCPKSCDLLNGGGNIQFDFGCFL